MNFEQFKQLPMIKDLPIYEQNRLFFNYKSDRMYELASLSISTSSSSAAGAGGSGQLQSQPIEDDNIIGPEISLEFYDINDAISFFEISDVNSVFEWNNILNFNDFPSKAGFSDELGTTITFSTVEVIGNRIVLTPPDYTLVYGFKWNHYDSNYPQLLIKVRITHPDVITGYLQISTNDVNLAENIIMSNPTLTDLANLEIYDLVVNTAFSNNDLNIYTTFYIDNMDIIEFNNNNLSSISELTLQDRTSLTSISGNDFSNSLTINLDPCSELQTFSNNIAPLLENIYLTGSHLENIDISGYSMLRDIYLIDNALTQSSVDHILSKLVEFGLDNGTVALENNSSGTNASPSAQGLLDKTTLEGRGWNVTVS